MKLANLVQELYELGLDGTLYRVGREVRVRSGLERLLETTPRPLEEALGERAWEHHDLAAWTQRGLFGDPRGVRAAIEDRICEPARRRLGVEARDAARGRLVCFGRWRADFGSPPDWHLHPTSGRRWNPNAHWSAALRDEGTIGDIKLTWEIGRFPHAYTLARAAALGAIPAHEAEDALDRQIRSFASCNPHPLGVHWNSAQEVAFRLMAWTFGVGTLARLAPGARPLAGFVARSAFTIGWHLERQIDFARHAVYNNHLLSEALGLYLVAWMLPACNETARWKVLGLELLDEQADRQVYEDGAYIQQSHNYHRVAMQDFLWAACLKRAEGAPVPERWRAAVERSLDFLFAHQNPHDGRLPNYGANDGAKPSLLSTCDFSDFRSTLQAMSVLTRGERVYKPGPYDEEVAWFLGPEALQAPLRPFSRRSVAFRDTGYVVLRGRDEGSFGAFRCGSLRDRFSQIDMLHVDLWWRGQNVCVDGGSYLYNDCETWHAHFMRTESHNTVQIDGLDQMVHVRKFKSLYWTRARLFDFCDAGRWALAVGEHYGYEKRTGCLHQRAVLFFKDDLWVVVDRIAGAGAHALRLHWLLGDFACDHETNDARATLSTPRGDFTLAVLDDSGSSLTGTLAKGQEVPHRGWMARYYGEKVPVPSLAVERRAPLPYTFVTILAAGRPEASVRDRHWTVRTESGDFCFVLAADGVPHAT